MQNQICFRLEPLHYLKYPTQSQYPYQFYNYIEDNILIDEILVRDQIHEMQVVKWTLTHDAQVRKLTMGTQEEPQYLKVIDNLNFVVVTTIEDLLKEYKDVFAWSYKDLKRISGHIAKHKIELNTSIPLTHLVFEFGFQSYYPLPSYWSCCTLHLITLPFSIIAIVNICLFLVCFLKFSYYLLVVLLQL